MKTHTQFVKCGNVHLDPEAVFLVGPSPDSKIGSCTVGIHAGQGAVMVPVDCSPSKVIEEIELWRVQRDKIVAERQELWQKEQLAAMAGAVQTIRIAKEGDDSDSWKNGSKG